MSPSGPEDLLRFWFGPDLESEQALAARSVLWFARNDGFDAELRAQFGALPERAAAGALDDWADAPRSALALVIALDQLPRNLFRDDPRSFAFDARALEIALAAIERGFDAALHPIEASFLYLPLEHAEGLAHQQRCVALFEALPARATGACRVRVEQFASYAARHHQVIQRFGRFPHRNALLGRAHTADERAYLDTGGETFGNQRSS